MNKGFLVNNLYFILGLMLVFNLIYPIFSRDSFASADPIPEPYFYNYPTVSNNTFGNTNPIKTVNWSYFKQLFNNHTDIVLQYKVNGSENWVNGNEYMEIGKTWDDSLKGWKINFTFNKPETANPIDARFIFSCDLSVLNYIDASGNYTYHLNYTIPNTNETYRVLFNWSDLLQYNNLKLNKGVQDNQFYFIIRRDNLPINNLTIVLDPFFGDDTEYGFSESIENYQKGLEITTSGSGTFDNISAYIEATANLFFDLTAMIYDSSGDLYDTTTETVNIPSGSDWYTLEFPATKQTFTDGQTYYITIFSSYSAVSLCGLYLQRSSGSNTYVAESDTYIGGAEDPVTWDITDASAEVSIYINYTPSVSLDWYLDDQSLNGEIFNLSWYDDDSSLNGNIFNLSWYQDDISLNGQIFNLSWYDDDSTLNGEIFNLSWYIDDQDLNGTIYNVSVLSWYIDDQDLNGTIYNISALSWYIDDESLNGNIYNHSWFIDDQTINGTIYNNTGWWIDNQDINGSIYNVSGTPTTVAELYDWILNNIWIQEDDEVEITPNAEFMGILLSLTLFCIFFIVGYTENKRSGGALMLFSAFIFLGFEALSSSYLNTLATFLLSPFAIFIMILGIRKWLYPAGDEKTKTEGQ